MIRNRNVTVNEVAGIASSLQGKGMRQGPHTPVEAQ